MTTPSAPPSLLACLSVELPGGTDLPEWVRLVPAGQFVTIDGRGFRADAALLASSVRLPIAVDFDHATERGPTTGQPGAAAGWVEALEARDDGLYGRVAWTSLGKTALLDRRHRHRSGPQPPRTGRSTRLSLSARGFAPVTWQTANPLIPMVGATGIEPVTPPV